ncbi:prefoldin subunit beta [Candidatus Micrarchaeota archaeon]|nr:prefoldin subunit beta [Candidatus Micrarchaeota archaeon]
MINMTEGGNLQQQIQILNMQKQQLSAQQKEFDNALEELKNAKGLVYKSAGNLLIEVSKEDAKKELEEKQETITKRLETLELQEKRLNSKLKNLEKE